MGWRKEGFDIWKIRKRWKQGKLVWNDWNSTFSVGSCLSFIARPTLGESPVALRCPHLELGAIGQLFNNSHPCQFAGFYICSDKNSCTRFKIDNQRISGGCLSTLCLHKLIFKVCGWRKLLRHPDILTNSIIHIVHLHFITSHAFNQIR